MSIFVFIIAFLFLFLSWKMRTGLKKDARAQESYLPAHGVISRTVFSETGNVRYYVVFVGAGKQMEAQTVYYSSRTKSLSPGDPVDIGYYFAKDGITPRAVIYDNRLVPCSDSVPGFCTLMAVIGAVLLLTGVLMLMPI